MFACYFLVTGEGTFPLSNGLLVLGAGWNSLVFTPTMLGFDPVLPRTVLVLLAGVSNPTPDCCLALFKLPALAAAAAC